MTSTNFRQASDLRSTALDAQREAEKAKILSLVKEIRIKTTELERLIGGLA